MHASLSLSSIIWYWPNRWERNGTGVARRPYY